MARGRPKGSKNKPKNAVKEAIRGAQKHALEVLSEEPKKSGPTGRACWGNKIYLVIETPKKSEPRLHSYTESEDGARSMVKLMQETRPSSKFHVLQKDVDWSKPVSIM